MVGGTAVGVGDVIWLGTLPIMLAGGVGRDGVIERSLMTD